MRETNIEVIASEVHELKEGRKQVFEKLDQKVDKVDLAELKESVDKIGTALTEGIESQRKAMISQNKEVRSYVFKGIMWFVGGFIATMATVITFFYNQNQAMQKAIEQYHDDQKNFELQIVKQYAKDESDIAVIKTQLKNLKLID